jgi:hypothetical protein
MPHLAHPASRTPHGVGTWNRWLHGRGIIGPIRDTAGAAATPRTTTALSFSPRAMPPSASNLRRFTALLGRAKTATLPGRLSVRSGELRDCGAAAPSPCWMTAAHYGRNACAEAPPYPHGRKMSPTGRRSRCGRRSSRSGAGARCRERGTPWTRRRGRVDIVVRSPAHRVTRAATSWSAPDGSSCWTLRRGAPGRGSTAGACAARRHHRLRGRCPVFHVGAASCGTTACLPGWPAVDVRPDAAGRAHWSGRPSGPDGVQVPHAGLPQRAREINAATPVGAPASARRTPAKATSWPDPSWPRARPFRRR